MKLPKVPGDSVTPKAPSAIDDELELSSSETIAPRSCGDCHLLVVLKTWASRIDWPLCSNLMFLIAAFIYLILGTIDIYATKFGEHVLVNVTYMDANNERHIAVRRRFRYSNAELVIYWNAGSLYNIMTIVACVLYILNPIFDFLGILVPPPNQDVGMAEPEGEPEPDQEGEPDTKDDNENIDDKAVEEYDVPVQEGCYDRVIDTLDQVWWDFWCPLWFLAASWMYITLAINDMMGNIDPQVGFILDIWASHLFVVDATCGVIYWWVSRQRSSGTAELFLFTRVPRQVDWTGWGDLLFLAGAAVDAINCYLYELSSWGPYLNLFTSLLWTLDCILYFISYKFERRSFLVSTEVLSHGPPSDSGEDTDSF